MSRFGGLALASFLAIAFAIDQGVSAQEQIGIPPTLNPPVAGEPGSGVSGQPTPQPLPIEHDWSVPSGSGLLESPTVELIPMPTEDAVEMSRTAWLAQTPPWSWFPWNGWENSAELGLNGASGNTESMTLQTGARFKRKTDWNVFDLRLLQNRTHNSGVTAQNNVLLYGDFERSLGESAWNVFVKQGLEYDELRAFDLRYFINSGLGYNWIDADGLLLSTRMGAGASRDFGGVEDRWKPEALFGATYEHQVNARHKLIAKLDFYPAWEDFSDFRTIADLSWEFLLAEAPNLSLKFGAMHRHDSQPDEAFLPNDLNYSALLLYKF
ncbi:MAG: DUF481 domain-containing protein [Planctomycetaceae bacterium]|nr:MAG: DUF481 domain-containing protein [Planctomycetaceae bacterium]